MKVPLYGAQKVEPAANLPGSLDVVKPGGFEQLEQSFGNVGKTVDKGIAAYEADMKEANAQTVADNTAALGNEYTDELNGNPNKTAPVADGTTPDQAFDEDPGTPGFLSLRGKSAMVASGDTLKTLEQLREKRASNIKDETARQLFLNHSADMLLQARGQVERHAGQQAEVAKEDTAKAVADEAVRAAVVDPSNDEVASQRVAGYAAAVHAMGRGEDFDNQRALEVQQRVAAARVSTLLGSGDWKRAGEVLEQNKYALGEHAAPLQEHVDQARDQVVGQAAALDAVSAATGPNGRVDDQKLEEELLKVPLEVQKAARATAYEAAAHRNKAAERADEQTIKEIWAKKNDVGWAFVPPDMKAKLNAIDPRLVDQFIDQSYRRFKETKGSKADALRAQADLNRDAMHDFKGLSVEEQAQVDLSPGGDFARAHQGVDVHGFKALAPVQRSAAATVEKGQAQPMEAFRGEAAANFEARLSTMPEKTPAQKAAKRQRLADVKAQAVDAWNTWAESHNGKPPSKAEAAKLVGDIVTAIPPTNAAEGLLAGKQISDRLDRLTGRNKQVSKYKVSPDGKQRVPVFSDGTYGTPESVP